MIKTRSISLLSLLSILIMSMTIFGCKDDERQDIKTKKESSIHLELTANVVTSLPVVSNTTKGFNLNVDHSGEGEMSTPINWNSDTWDNGDNKPVVLAVVRDKSSLSSVSAIKKLESSEYTYEPGHGAVSSKIRISADFPEPSSNNEILFYLLDKNDFESKYDESNKTLSFNGGASLYNIVGGQPVFNSYIPDNVFVEPNERVFFNFIFSGSIDLSNYKGSNGLSNEFDMNPVGTLLMTDFSTLDKGDQLDNPAYVEGFYPTLTTNAFDLNTKLNLLTGVNTNHSTTPNDQQISFYSYDPTGRTNTPNTSTSNKIGGVSNKLSGVYVKYVLGRANSSFKIKITNNDYTIFNNDSQGDFSEIYKSSRVGLNLIVNSESTKPTNFYGSNALWYVADYNVNKDQTGWASSNPKKESLVVDWEQANSLFANSTNTFLKDYHLPTKNEWISIIPMSKDRIVYINFSGSDILEDDRTGDLYDVKIGNSELKNTKSYYQTKQEDEDHVTYAIRFAEGTLVKDVDGKDVNISLTTGRNPYISVWRYSYIDGSNPGEKKMAIYCKVLPANTIIEKGTDLKIDTGSGMIDFKNKSFFTENSTGKLKPGVVYRELTEHPTGNTGPYWASTPMTPDKAYFSIFFPQGAYSLAEDRSKSDLMVRPFKGATVVDPIPENNALSYVAERNVNEAQTGWGDGSNADCALVNWKDAKGLFTNGSNTFLNGYHLPSRYEWQSIFPNSNSYVRFDEARSVNTYSGTGDDHKVEIGKAVIENAKSYYETTDEMEDGKYVTYAVRFYEGTLVKDNEGEDANNKLLKEGSNPYISVWRYSYVNNPNVGGGKMIAVYCKVLPANTTFNKETLELTINGNKENFKNKSFFAESNGTPKTGVVYREVPTSGYSLGMDFIGTSGGCWSSSPYNHNESYVINFGKTRASGLKDYNSLGLAVRPFIGIK